MNPLCLLLAAIVLATFDDLPEVMRVRFLAAYLDIGVNAAYELVASKRIASIRIGKRSIRITRDALAEFLNGDAAQSDDASQAATPIRQERRGHGT